MDTTTDAPTSAPNRLRSQPDPAAVWAPLGGLADAAARCADTGAVAISRGFDRKSRLRGKALRDLLEDRGVSAIEMTSAPGSERLLAGTEVAVVVNLLGVGTWQPHRLAAKLRAPLLAPSATENSPASDVERDVIGVAGADGARDVALSRVAVLPETAEAALTVTCDDRARTLVGGRVEVTLHEHRLEVHIEGEDTNETITADTVTVETSGGPHRLIRDELPIAEFEGELSFTAEVRGLVVRSV